MTTARRNKKKSQALLCFSGFTCSEKVLQNVQISFSFICRYAEIKDYDFNDPRFSSKTGHFTQVNALLRADLVCAGVAFAVFIAVIVIILLPSVSSQA